MSYNFRNIFICITNPFKCGNIIYNYVRSFFYELYRKSKSGLNFRISRLPNLCLSHYFDT